jgi:transcriptional regulator with PAS, ATPase and Fis domain
MASHLSLDLARLQAALVHWVSHEAQRGLFVTDSHFRVIVWNQWMEIHSGRSSADVAGRSLFELYPDTIERGIREY